MLTFIYILLLILILIIFYILFKKNAFKNINYFSVLCSVYFVFGIIPSIIMMLGFGDGYYFSMPFSNNNEVIKIGSIFILWGLLGILIPFILIDKLLKNKVLGYSLSGYKYGLFKINSQIVWIYALLLLFFYGLYLIESTPVIPQMIVNGFSEHEIAQRRLMLTQYYTGNGYIKTITFFFAYVLSLCLGVLVNKSKNLFPYILILPFCLLVLSSTGEKASITFSILYFLFGITFNSKFKFKKILLITILFFLFLSLLTYIQFDLAFTSSISRLIERIFIAQSAAVYLSVDQYLNNASLLLFNSVDSSLFRTLLFLNNSLPAASESYVELYYPGLREVGTWNVNGLYIHESLANFGILGVIFSPIIIGIIYYFILLTCFLFKKYYFISIFYTYITFGFVPILTSFNRILFNTEAILVLISLISIGIFYIILSSKFKK